MKSATDIIIRPIVTEKTMGGSADRKYTFEVARDATKIDIGRAVEELFNVKVESVNTMHVSGKKTVRAQSRRVGYTSDWKKATVRLTSDSKSIEFFDSLM